MNDEKRSELSALLADLSLRETHRELNRFIDKRDVENAKRLSKVEAAITTILEYLER